MNFLCPACRTPLPRVNPEHATCSGCGVAVDLTRVDTAPGQARLWPEIDLSGETLSGFALEKLLGSGGMGSVYEARSPDGKIIALKVLSPLLAAEPSLRERFRREARALSALSHPGIVKMLGEGEENSFCWYAMERVHGLDLRERLKQGALPAAEVIALAHVMLDALEVVHESGFIHRDVKPSNILLAPEGPKLCDFGIARLEGTSTLTESAALLGSLRYMAPEQRWGKSDARSDLYALGVVLHEALALGVPGERTLPPSTPASLTRLIAKLTETSAVLRPQSARAAKRLLTATAKRPVQLAATAVLIAGLASVATILWSQRPMESLSVDAGVPAVADAEPAPDAGAALAVAAADPAPDAGLAALAVAEAVPDSGSEPLAEKTTLAVDAGTSLLAVLGGTSGISTAPATRGTPFLRGELGTSPKPTKRPVTKPLSKKKSTVVAETEPAPELGTLSVQSAGPGTVFDGKQTLGAAPGEFSLSLGGHAIWVVCTVGGERQGFKVGINAGSPQTITADCPAQ